MEIFNVQLTNLAEKQKANSKKFHFKFANLIFSGIGEFFCPKIYQCPSDYFTIAHNLCPSDYFTIQKYVIWFLV